MEREDSPLVILGGGYTGKVIWKHAVTSGRPVRITSREPDRNLESIPIDVRIRFELERAETWANLPEHARVIWTFPADSLRTLSRFIDCMEKRISGLLVLGSTSSYLAGDGNEPVLVDENTPLDPADRRGRGEELLRTRLNAIILRSSGIYGPNRNPLDWIRKRQLKNSSRMLNLIHVDDLAEFSLMALASGATGEIYNLSDGHPITVSEIVEAAVRLGLLEPIPGNPEKGAGKIVSNRKVRLHFNYSFLYPDLYLALAELERANPASR